jgi:hypothetical protein
MVRGEGLLIGWPWRRPRRDGAWVRRWAGGPPPSGGVRARWWVGRPPLSGGAWVRRWAGGPPFERRWLADTESATAGVGWEAAVMAGRRAS